MQQSLLDHLDIWTKAIETRSTSGRGSRSKLNLYGIKKLRELILDLAVRGQLVPQDPNDEPARILLEKIAAEKEQLIKAGKIKKQKALPPIGEDEKPFELPEGWEWARLGNITNYGLVNKVETENVSDSTWILELEDIEKETSKLLKRISFKERKFKSSKNRFFKNDIIYGKLRPYLDKVIVAEDDGVCTTEMIPFRAHSNFIPAFLRLTLKTPYFVRYANKSTHGMNLPRLGTDKARLALIPILSMKEQHRIVAKVNELMTLCDALEQAQTQHIQAHQTLVEHLLAALTQAANQGDFEQAWARIAEHFDTLFTTEHSIDQLKQTLLQLAVMGKLVPQDPNDEPASVLLETIAAEKARLIKEKKIKKQKALPPISDEEKPFELPDGWAWCRIGHIAYSTDYGLSLKTMQNARGVPVLAMGNIKNGEVLVSNDKVVPEHIEELPELYLSHRDLLYNRTNSAELVGKAGIFLDNSKKYTFASYLIRINLDKTTLLPEIVNLNMMTPLFRQTQIEPHLKQQCGQANVNGTLMKNMLVAIAPTTEQERIIEKTNQLTTLCDQLKTHLAKQQTTQNQLADALKKL